MGEQEKKRRRKGYWPSHQTRVAQHTGERVAAAAHGGLPGAVVNHQPWGHSTNLSLTQTGPPLAQLWPSHTYYTHTLHEQGGSEDAWRRRKKCTWLSAAQRCSSTLEVQSPRAKRRLTVTLWHSLWASLERSRQAEAAHNLQTTSCPSPKGKNNLTAYRGRVNMFVFSSLCTNGGDSPPVIKSFAEHTYR